MRGKVISKDDTAIAFDQSGQGPVVILVGGALGDRSASEPLAALVAEHFTVLNYDRRGRGESGDTLPYAVEREIEDIDALIKEGGGSAFVLGGSSGAVLALEASARGLAIKKLALYEPPFIIDESRPPLPKDYVTQLNEMIAAGQRGDAVAFFMTKAVGMPAEAIVPMRRTPFGRDFRQRHTHWPMMAPSWERRCQAIRCPEASGTPSRSPRSSWMVEPVLHGCATRYKRSWTSFPAHSVARWKIKRTLSPQRLLLPY